MFVLFAMKFDPSLFSGAGVIWVFAMTLGIILLGALCPDAPTPQQQNTGEKD